LAECTRLQSTAAASAAEVGSLLPEFDVVWVNAHGESGSPYDIIVRRRWVPATAAGAAAAAAAAAEAEAGAAAAAASGSGGGTPFTVVRHVEVKGTMAPAATPGRPLSLIVSAAEMAWAHSHARSFELWVVSGLSASAAGPSGVCVTRIRNPMACINVPPVRLSLYLELRAGQGERSGPAPKLDDDGGNVPMPAPQAARPARLRVVPMPNSPHEQEVPPHLPMVAPELTPAQSFAALVVSVLRDAGELPTPSTLLRALIPADLVPAGKFTRAVQRAVPTVLVHNPGSPSVAFSLPVEHAPAPARAPAVPVPARAPAVPAPAPARAPAVPAPAPARAPVVPVPSRAPVVPVPAPARAPAVPAPPRAAASASFAPVLQPPSAFADAVFRMLLSSGGKPVTANLISQRISHLRPPGNITKAVVNAIPGVIVHGAGTAMVSFSLPS
jgi:hypothetical protein